jgi:TolA-binding protein
LLTKHKYFAALGLVLLAFPAAALAAGGGQHDPATARVRDAERVQLAPLQRPIDRFQRVVHTIAHRIRVQHRAAVRRHRRELFERLPAGVSLETLEAIAACESGGDPTAVSSDGSYRGKYQFDFGTWESVGGDGDPATAPESEQDYRAALLYARSGSSPWPVCG